MSIRNYTSSVPVDRSISQIEQKLVSFGARNIGKQYDDKRRLMAVQFDLWDGKKSYNIQLPANVEKVFERMKADRVRINSYDALREQAARTAWKLMLDWVDLQLTMILLNQAEPLEIFMPYMFDGKRTLYQIARQNDFKMALPAPEVRA